jgi:hypothetical protein
MHFHASDVGTRAAHEQRIAALSPLSIHFKDQKEIQNMHMNSVALCFRSLLVASAAIVTVVGCSTKPAGRPGLDSAKLSESAGCKDLSQCLKDSPDAPELCAINSSTLESAQELYDCLLEGRGEACASKCVDPKPVADDSCRVGAECLLDPARGLNDLSCVAMVTVEWVPSLMKCLQSGQGIACADQCAGTPPVVAETTQCPDILPCLDNFDPFNANSDLLCAEKAPVEWQKTVSDCLKGGGGKTCATRCVGTPPSIEIPVPKPKTPPKKTDCLLVLECLQEPNRISSDPACAAKAPAAWQSTMTTCLNSNGGETCVDRCVGTPPPPVVEKPKTPPKVTACLLVLECLQEPNRISSDPACAKQAPAAWQSTMTACLKGNGGETCVDRCVGTPPPVVTPPPAPIPVPKPAADTRCEAAKFDQCISALGKNYEDCSVHCPQECQPSVIQCLKGSGGKECARSYCSKSI